MVLKADQAKKLGDSLRELSFEAFLAGADT